MAHRHFEGVLHAQMYGKFRPVPPKALITRVIDYLKEKYSGPLDLAYDVGAGSGQSTGFFSPFFKTVVGTDISAAQVENAVKANQLPNLQFQVSPAEEIATKDASVQLVTACQAAHWFDLPKFYKEAHRVLVPNGVLALCGYEFPAFVTGDSSRDAKLDARLQHLYKVELWKHVLPGSVSVYVDKYKLEKFQFGRSSVAGEVTEGVFQFADPNDAGFNFVDFKREEGFYDDSKTSLREMISYGLTWSGYQSYLKNEGEEQANKIMENYERDLLAIFGDSKKPAEDIHFTRRTRYFLLMGRKG